MSEGKRVSVFQMMLAAEKAVCWREASLFWARRDRGAKSKQATHKIKKGNCAIQDLDFIVKR